MVRIVGFSSGLASGLLAIDASPGCAACVSAEASEISEQEQMPARTHSAEA